MIRTPSDLTAYLYALALQLPGVAQVITGEGSRQEQSTLAKARYPQILIEIPESGLPVAESQKTLSTRIFVLERSVSERHADQDIASDTSYGIAEALVRVIQAHSYDDDFGFSLTDGTIEITPIIARGSDQLRGWTLELQVSVDSSCLSYDADTFFMPQFRVSISGDPGAPLISVENTSIGSTGVTSDMWWREEIAGTLQDVTELSSTSIQLSATDPVSTYRIIHIWLRMVRSNITLWSYARVHSADTGGLSIPFTPHYPV